jgi:hypothetical protein
VRWVIARGLIALAALSALAACSNSADESDSPNTPSTSQASSPTSSPTSTPSASQPSTPSPTTPPVASTPSSTPSSPPTGTPFPQAKDGQNYKACNDGNCEVLIRKVAKLTIDGDKYTATVVKGTLKITSNSGYVSISGGGLASWSNGNGPLHSASLKAVDGDTAVVILRT